MTTTPKQKIEETIGTGRRKTAVSSVRLRAGNGQVRVNGEEFATYFPTEVQRQLILVPLKMAAKENDFDLLVRVKGGGIEAQAVATRLGIARALVSRDESLRKYFKEENLLTRDSRKRERKKYGRAGARKSFQFSKR